MSWAGAPRAPAQCQFAKLLPDARVGAGWSVAISGDVALMGAPGDSRIAQAAGAAYVHRWERRRWIWETDLRPSAAQREDGFGRSVAIDGDFALLGGPRADGAGWFTGAVSVFRHEAGVWNELGWIVGHDTSYQDFFGWSVAIEGDVAVVGAKEGTGRGPKTGAAYVFRFDGTDWIEEQKIFAADGAGFDEFGASLDISGDVIVVGAPNDADLGNWSGSAYVFERIAGVWTQTGKLLASDGGPLHSFGQSVAVSGRAVLAGAVGATGRAQWTGAVYSFEPDVNGLWRETQKLYASDGRNSDVFGAAVAIEGNHAIIGAPGADVTGPASGATYVFNRPATGAPT